MKTTSKLDNFTELIFKNLIDNLPDLYVYWKNVNSVYMGCNQKLAELCNFSSPDEVIGKKDEDFYWGESLGKQFCEDDEYVIKNGAPLKSCYLIPHDDNDGLVSYKIIKTEKFPIFGLKKKTMGIVGVARDISSDLSEIAQFINSKISFPHDAELDNKMKLTKREYEILYLSNLGKSPKEIAWILGSVENKQIAATTVNAIINKRIFPKFNVNSMCQLSEKLKTIKALQFIPYSLINCNALLYRCYSQ